jgi:hypothetical protein
MGRKNFNAFLKKQKEEKKRKKNAEKRKKKEERKGQSTSGKLEDMLAYVDEYGNIVSANDESESESDADTEADNNEEKSPEQ